MNEITNLETVLIAEDIIFCLDLIRLINTHEHKAVLVFGLIPFASHLVIDTYEYFRDANLEYSKTLKINFEKVIRESRARIKLVDNITEIDNLMEEIVAFHKRIFIEEHKGALGWLKRWLATDLGLFFYKQHLISNSHIATLIGNTNLLSIQSMNEFKQNAPSISQSFGEGLGKYIAQIHNDLSLNNFSQHPSVQNNIVFNELTHRDVKSDKFYKAGFNGEIAFNINWHLYWILTTVNFLRYVLPDLTFDTSNTVLKMKFFTLYHAVASLKKIQSYGWSENLLTSRSKHFLQQIVADPDLKPFVKRSKKVKTFRNTVVHYQLKDFPKSSMNPNVRLYGLVEYYFDGSTFEELDKFLNNQLRQISEILELWEIESSNS